MKMAEAYRAAGLSMVSCPKAAPTLGRFLHTTGSGGGDEDDRRARRRLVLCLCR